jgi:hypothetical protein
MSIGIELVPANLQSSSWLSSRAESNEFISASRGFPPAKSSDLSKQYHIDSSSAVPGSQFLVGIKILLHASVRAHCNSAVRSRSAVPEFAAAGYPAAPGVTFAIKPLISLVPTRGIEPRTY